jgi:hypothetical protein
MKWPKCRAPRCRRAAEDVVAGGVDHALVQVHRTAGLAGDRLGHEHRVQAVAQRHFLGRHLEQEGLVGHRQRVAVQQVDLVLRVPTSWIQVSARCPARPARRGTRPRTAPARSAAFRLKADCPDFGPAAAARRRHQGWAGSVLAAVTR